MKTPRSRQSMFTSRALSSIAGLLVAFALPSSVLALSPLVNSDGATQPYLYIAYLSLSYSEVHHGESVWGPPFWI